VRAVPITTHGGPDVLTLQDVPEPARSTGDALVRVRACALNHLDLWQRRGIARVAKPLPHIPGSDIAGEVADGGPSGLASGARVIVHPGLTCGHCAACLAGNDSLCDRYGIVGYQTDGGYAELVAVPAENLLPIPEGISFEAAAAFPLTFLTAWHMLVSRANVRAGETVLVIAAGSGVGQAAVQVAKLHGARVIATGGDARKLEAARALGADEAVDHYAAGLTDEVRRLTSGRGVDVVIEHVGEAVWDRVVKCLARGGRLVTCGATSGYHGAVDLRALFSRQLSLLGSYMGTRADLDAAWAAFGRGELQPVVDSVLSLADASEAHRRLETHGQFGKVVLQV
jgi:NADPH:quinone reductase-like Zn-dependent oxidoreductase